MDKKNNYIGSSEAAKIIGVSIATLYNLEKKGLIRVYKNPPRYNKSYLLEDLLTFAEDVVPEID